MTAQCPGFSEITYYHKIMPESRYVDKRIFVSSSLTVVLEYISSKSKNPINWFNRKTNPISELEHYEKNI